ncbi:MAG: MFS transporter [Planctomycetes bacterium]|nr:MFS transporter [Planctomycetota bacterium]
MGQARSRIAAIKADSITAMATAGSTNQLGFERNVKLYPWYQAFYNAFAWMPVFFLYFSQHLTLDGVLRLEAIYYIVVVILEVPSGYFSDVVGRKKTLLISTTALIFSYILFALGGGFAIFAIAQALLAMGISFASGTDTSFHYDSLASIDREDQFAQREAVVARNTFLSGAIAALIGGCLGAIDLRFAYVASAVAAVGTLTIVLLFTEPRSHQQATVLGRGFISQLKKCVSMLSQRSLAWLFGFAVLMVVLNHIPYEFYQTYIKLTSEDIDAPLSMAPAIAGLHMAVAMLIGSYIAAHSIRLRDRLGIGPTLLLCVVIQTVIIAVMGSVLSIWIVPLILFRVAPRALMTAPFNAAVTPRIPQAQRATYLSIQSLVGRLAFSAVLLGLSFLAQKESASDWISLKKILLASTFLALVGLVILSITHRWCFKHDSQPVSE